MLKVNEIFFSIQGESSFAGYPCAFVRLSECNLRCSYCDTAHAFHEGRPLPLQEVIASVLRYPAGLVEITGGEPLLQADTLTLVAILGDRGKKVLIETNGSVSIEGVDARATIIMDIKTPGSGMSDHMRWSNLHLLRRHDEIKLVLTDRADFEWALGVVRKHDLHQKHVVHLAPAFGILEPHRLASWMLECPDLPTGVRLQLQLHRYIWPHVERGV
ncbi:MAG: radical SAM protein [Candidatus Abyssubacteria bacterium]